MKIGFIFKGHGFLNKKLMFKIPLLCMVLGWGVRSQEGTVRGVRSQGVWSPPFLCGHTDTCENITFPQLRLQAVIILDFPGQDR